MACLIDAITFLDQKSFKSRLEEYRKRNKLDTLSKSEIHEQLHYQSKFLSHTDIRSSRSLTNVYSSVSKEELTSSSLTDLSDRNKYTDTLFRPIPRSSSPIEKTSRRYTELRVDANRTLSHNSSLQAIVSPSSPFSLPEPPRYVSVAFSPLRQSRNCFDLWSKEDRMKIEKLIEHESQKNNTNKSCNESLPPSSNRDSTYSKSSENLSDAPSKTIFSSLPEMRMKQNDKIQTNTN